MFETLIPKVFQGVAGTAGWGQASGVPYGEQKSCREQEQLVCIVPASRNSFRNRRNSCSTPVQIHSGQM